MGRSGADRSAFRRVFRYIATPFAVAIIITGLQSCSRGTGYMPCLFSVPGRFLVLLLIAGVVSGVLSAIFGMLVGPVVMRFLGLDDRTVLRWDRAVVATFIPMLAVTGTVLHTLLQQRYTTSAGTAFSVSATSKLLSAVNELLVSFSFAHGFQYVNMALISQYLAFALGVFVTILAVNTYVTMIAVHVVWPVMLRRRRVCSFAAAVRRWYRTPRGKILFVLIAVAAGTTYAGLSSATAGSGCGLSAAAEDVWFQSEQTVDGTDVTVVVEDYYHMDVLYLRETGAGTAHKIYFSDRFDEPSRSTGEHGAVTVYTYYPNGTMQVASRPLQASGTQRVHDRMPPESPVLFVTFSNLSTGDTVIASADGRYDRRGCTTIPYPVGTYEVSSG